MAAATQAEHRLAAATSTMAVTAATASVVVEGRLASAASAMAVTAATASVEVEGRLAAAATATAVAMTATAALSGRGSSTAPVAVAAAGLCCQRGRNRQSGDARGEEHPAQHEKSPSERRKRPVRCTVPTAKRMELAA
jgi:hypothetical protein